MWLSSKLSTLEHVPTLLLLEVFSPRMQEGRSSAKSYTLRPNYIASPRITLVPRGIDCNIIVAFLQQFCNGFVGVGDPDIGSKSSKALQNCYKYVGNMLLVCLYTVSKRGVYSYLEPDQLT